MGSKYHNYHHLVRKWCQTGVDVAFCLYYVGRLVEQIVKLLDLVSFYMSGVKNTNDPAAKMAS